MNGTDSRQILVVEDEPGSREALVELLRDEGHEVEAAPDGESAIKVLDNKVLELLVLDYHLPDMTGADLLRHVRKAGRGCHAIMVSGSVGVTSEGEDLAVVDHWAECKALGAVAQLTKPVKFDHLMEVIDGLPRPSS